MSRIKLYPAFNHWQQWGNIVLFSDPHWGDLDRELMNYPFSDYEQYKTILKGTPSSSTLVCLGDVGAPKWISYLKNKRNHLHTVLIKGNHDRGSSYYEDYFDEIYEGPLFISPKILLSHEPVYGLPWCFNYHGHLHRQSDTLLESKNHLCLSGNLYLPQTLELNKDVQNGRLKNIPDIHRFTIDNAIANSNE